MMNRNRHNLVIGLLVCLVIVFLVCPSWATSPQDVDDDDRNATPVKRATIAKKTRENITTTIGDRFAVSPSTLVVGIDGKQVSLRKMLVPCDAEISYDYEDGVKTAQRIQQLRVTSSATTGWSNKRTE